jgi:hypothetical protein
MVVSYRRANPMLAIIVATILRPRERESSGIVLAVADQ